MRQKRLGRKASTLVAVEQVGSQREQVVAPVAVEIGGDEGRERGVVGQDGRGGKSGCAAAFGQRQIRRIDGGGDVVPSLVLLFAPSDGQVAADD